MTKTITTYGIVALVAVLVMSTVAIAFSQSAVAAPANKTIIGSGGIGAQIAADNWQTIISGTIKTSTPSDLVISHDQECTIHTGLNLDQDNEQATSAIRQDIKLVVDGVVQPAVWGDDGENMGMVTLCSRAYQIDTNLLSTVYDLCSFVEGAFEDDTICSDDEIYFDSFIRTKQTHGWHWVVLDVGSGEHFIEVKSKLVHELEGVEGNQNGKKGPAKDTGDPTKDTVDTVLEIGKRNLIVTEEKLATGSTN